MAREFKDIDGVSIFYDSQTCYLNKAGKNLKLKPCNVVEIRNVDLRYSRDMPSTSLMNFKKPTTCHYDRSQKMLFCGIYKP